MKIVSLLQNLLDVEVLEKGNNLHLLILSEMEVESVPQVAIG